MDRISGGAADAGAVGLAVSQVSARPRRDLAPESQGFARESPMLRRVRRGLSTACGSFRYARVGGMVLEWAPGIPVYRGCAIQLHTKKRYGRVAVPQYIQGFILRWLFRLFL